MRDWPICVDPIDGKSSNVQVPVHLQQCAACINAAPGAVHDNEIGRIICPCSSELCMPRTLLPIPQQGRKPDEHVDAHEGHPHC